MSVAAFWACRRQLKVAVGSVSEKSIDVSPIVVMDAGPSMTTGAAGLTLSKIHEALPASLALPTAS